MDKQLAWTDAQKNNVALAQSYHVGKWYSKFGRIPPSGLRGDSVMDRLTEVLTDVCFCVSLRTKYPCVSKIRHTRVLCM